MVLRRTRHSVVSAALLAAQTLLILLLASRVVGGAVALQVAFNFYVLPIALIATPIGLALLPELSDLVPRRRGRRLHRDPGARARVGAVPGRAGGGGLRPARRSDRATWSAVGQMGTPLRPADDRRVARGAGARAVGQTVCFVSTQASYARGDTVTPLWCMVAQALGLPGAVRRRGRAVGRRRRWSARSPRRTPSRRSPAACCCSCGVARRSPGRCWAGSARPRCASGPAWRSWCCPCTSCRSRCRTSWPGRAGSAAALVAGSRGRAAVFLGAQHLLRVARARLVAVRRLRRRPGAGPRRGGW